MIKKIFIFSFISLFIYCSKPNLNKGYKEISFKKEDLISINVTSKVVKNIGDSITNPNSLLCINDRLIISEFGTKGLMHIIDLKKDKYIGLFGSKGRGPGEMSNMNSITKNNDRNLQAYNHQLNKLVVFNIDSLIAKKRFLTEFKLEKLKGISSALAFEEKIYSTSFLKGDHRAYVSDNKGNIISGLGEIPVIEKEGVTERMIAEGHSVYMQHWGNLLVFNYLTAPMIQIYDLKSKDWVLIKGPENFPSIFEKHNNEMAGIAYTKETRLGYIDLKISEKYIYALYNGKKLFEASSTNNENCNTIFVFDLNGLPVKQIILDKGIVKFDVYQDRYIYGSRINSEFKSEILKFKI